MTTKWGLVGNEKDTLIDETEISVGEWLEYSYYKHSIMDSFYVDNKMTMSRQKFLLTAAIPNFTVAEKYKSIKDYIVNPSNRVLKKFDGLRGTIYLPISQNAYKVDSIKNKLIFYINTPITNITYEEVMLFCEWRSKIDALVSRCYNKDYFFQYSLPSKEWSYRLIPKMDSVNNNHPTFNYKNAQINIMDKKDVESFFNYNLCGKYPMSIFSFKDYKVYKGCKIYNLRGNVAEMTNEKGVAFGGSYFHSAFLSNVNEFIKYESSEEWLGFRCIAVKIETTKADLEY